MNIKLMAKRLAAYVIARGTVTFITKTRKRLSIIKETSIPSNSRWKSDLFKKGSKLCKLRKHGF